MLGLWLLIAVVLFIRNQNATVISLPPILNENVISSRIYDVKKISVIDGNTFDLLLKDDSVSRILAQLPVKGVGESKKKIVELLNHCEKPKVFLKEKEKDGKWIVDMTVQVDSKEINIVDWLKTNNLIYN